MKGDTKSMPPKRPSKFVGRSSMERGEATPVDLQSPLEIPGMLTAVLPCYFNCGFSLSFLTPFVFGGGMVALALHVHRCITERHFV